jgi:serine/threonine protein kinase
MNKRLQSHIDDATELLQQGKYQPAEQRAGNPQLNSDIYSIGMIVLESLTGQSPDWLVTASGQQSLTNLVKADSKIVKLFERMVSPNHHIRFKSAGEALEALPLGLLSKGSQSASYQPALLS